MPATRHAAVALAVLVLAPVPSVRAQDPVTVINGDRSISLTPERLAALPRVTVKPRDHGRARIEVRDAP